MSVRIFFSYSRSDDEAFVRCLYEGLTAAGFDVWFDRISMPSRQLTFHQEIRDAIAAQDRLVLVVGPEAAKSDHVTQEWRFAYFEAVKCVNPIVRLNGKDAAGNPIDGYSLIPEDLRLIHAEDFRKDDEFAQHLANLVRQLNDPLPPAGKLVAVPELPPHYLAQRDRVNQLRDILLADLRKPVVVTGAAGRVGVHGMGGIGKSVLACALAHDPEIQRAFPDGVYWVTLGQQPKVDDQQRWLAHELGGKDDFLGVEAGKETLRALLKERAALVVLDDVWQRDHAEAFNVVGPRGRLLLTTRDAGLVTALAARENHYQVQLPTESEARFMLAKAAGIPPENLPPEAREVIAECGRLPLALALCGGMVRGAESSPGIPWSDLLEALREHDLEFLSSSHPAEEQHASVWKAINVSLRALPEEQRTRFAELAVFGLDTGAPEAAVVTLWEHTASLRPREARKMLSEFVARSLVHQPEAGRMILHDLLHHFAIGMAPKQFGSIKALHQLLLDAYRQNCAAGWPSGPNDGYFLENLCHHLIKAGEVEDAVTLLDGLAWIEVKCRAGLVFALREDYRHTIAALPEAQPELREDDRQKTELVQWTKTLIECAEQKRLPKSEEIIQSVRPWTDEEIAAECKRIISNPTRLDRLKAFVGFLEQECYPLVEFGMRTAFVMQHAFNSAPNGPVHEAGSSKVASVGAPVLLRHWPTSAEYNPRPACLRVLEGHKDSVRSVSVTPDGRGAVSASGSILGGGDWTVRVWDLETGQCLRVLEGHSDCVECVSITPDARLVVSGSRDKTVRLWHIETGECLLVLRGHDDARIIHIDGQEMELPLIELPVSSVSVSPDGQNAISTDQALRVWDLNTGKCVRSFDYSGSGLTVTPDGHRALSNGWESGAIQLLDLETGECLRTLEGQTAAVNSVSLTPDGRRAVSASADGTLRVWDVDSGICVWVLDSHVSAVITVTITPDGRRAISGGEDGKLQLWDLETGASLRILEGHSDGIESVSLTPDGRIAVSGSRDKTLRVWNLVNGEYLDTFARHATRVFPKSMSLDGRRLLSAGRDQTLRVWDLETADCTNILSGHNDVVTDVSVTRDWGRAVSASKDRTLKVWDLEAFECVRTLEGHTGNVVVAVTPDGRRVVSGSYGIPQLSNPDLESWEPLRVWDLDTGDCLFRLEGHRNWILDVSVTPDGRQAVSASADRSLRVWDLETGYCVHTLECPVGNATGVILTPDGRRALVPGQAFGQWYPLWVWELETGTCLPHDFEGHSDYITSVNPTSDGHRAVSASADRTLRVWNLNTGHCVRVLDGHTDSIVSASLSGDERRAVSASLDNTLRVWDLETGACLAVVRLSAPGDAVAVTRDLRRIVAGISTGEVLFFDVRGLDI